MVSAAVTPPGGEDFVGAEEQDLPPGAHFLSEYVYVLSLDEELNDLTREEFYYDQVEQLLITSLNLQTIFKRDLQTLKKNQSILKKCFLNATEIGR